MLEESLPDARLSLRALDVRAGEGSPQTNLMRAITGLYKVHQRVVPLFAGVFAAPTLLAAYRKSLIPQNKGPHLAITALERYIEVEQKSGRIDKSIDAHLSASMLFPLGTALLLLRHSERSL
jgi:hypothetical protein